MLKIIASVNSAGYIGKGNKLLYNDKRDMLHFKSTTMNDVVIMGYNTYLSMNRKPLKNRVNIVLTNNHLEIESTDRIIFTNSISLILDLSIDNTVWVIGGGEIYEKFIDLCYEIVLTEIDDDRIGDTKFPYFDKSKYVCSTIDSYDNVVINSYKKILYV